jgi:hypothetical protein
VCRVQQRHDAAGLGPKSTTCFIISGKDNQGDGVTVCDKGKDYKAPDGYEVRLTGCLQSVQGQCRRVAWLCMHC